MRVIVNIPSNSIAEAAGWRAKEVYVSDKSEANLEEVLKAVILLNGSSIYNSIYIEETFKKSNLLLFVNGVRMPETPDMNTIVRDNTQIHLMDRS